MPVFRNQSYAAFLFDMDGTLLDSAAVVRRVWAAWATKHGVHVPTLLVAMHGVRAEDTVRRFAGEGLDIPAEIEWIHEAELGDVDGLVPMEGICELLARLREEEWAVVTSATLQLATVRIRAARLRDSAAAVTTLGNLHRMGIAGDPRAEIASSVDLFAAQGQKIIDLAAHWVADNGWGTADDAGSTFDALVEHGVSDRATIEVVQAAVGLRNRIAHGYAALDPERLYDEAREGIPHLERFLAQTADAAGI